MGINGRLQQRATCTNPALRRDLNDLQFGWFDNSNPSDQARKQQVESHVRECRYCAVDFQNLQDMSDLLRQNRHLLYSPSRKGTAFS